MLKHVQTMYKFMYDGIVKSAGPHAYFLRLTRFKGICKKLNPCVRNRGQQLVIYMAKQKISIAEPTGN